MIKQQSSTSLIFCIAMDLIGYATYAIPGFGEFGDIIWAPISALIFFVTFGGWKGALGGAFNFVEEILPGTDFIPSFTIMWFLKRLGKTQKQEPIRTIKIG
ncbi:MULTISPECIES: hypothetical protein [Niastella]|uniref:Uncharacterized protein n=1 Tax=Niastella soli TaxID=2821487 RepID=A0ABS3YPM6_9BACT|nr:hypothetical protein [Niastella soli]MBO9199837.1 hypothetical protein [Niastella soli]